MIDERNTTDGTDGAATQSSGRPPALASSARSPTAWPATQMSCRSRDTWRRSTARPAGSTPSRLTPEGLRGRVVLVDFWTYTCINWLRTLPYVRAWDAKYADAGPDRRSASTPPSSASSGTSTTSSRIRATSASSTRSRSTATTGSGKPSRITSGRRCTSPTAEGRIRYHHFGEGEYAMTEMVIQQLLIDAGAEGVDQDLVTVEPRGLEVAADWRTLRSPETYLGYGQSTGFASDDVARVRQAPRLCRAPTARR